jgi:hypothetical protein
MGIGRAIEVIKVLGPYVENLRKETEPLHMLQTLVADIQERNPADSMRLLALMFGVPIDSLMEKFGDPAKAGSLLLKALIQGFAANPLPDLVNAGTMFGLLEEGWTNVRTE